MAINYKEVVPWGRDYSEYVRMFDLKETELKAKILGCGDGPANFNMYCNARGGDVVSIDPIYALTRAEIDQRIKDTYQSILSQTRKNKDLFVWESIKSVEQLGDIRMAAMKKFLSSFEAGLDSGNYIAGSLPDLPFEDNQFDICLSSHFLLLYSDNLSLQFHLDSIKEMLRVSSEVRIFPLLNTDGKTSVYLPEILTRFNGYWCETRRVDYEFQKGGNEMLLIKRKRSTI